ncbi:hypothetical protein BGZ54_004097 [Gamsiella multidivaricata]|nr:hypothetical protein BGZ54_004097 [Gamsiella multidivaricata]
MGACFGKPDRKNQGYVLGGGNASSNGTAGAPTTASGKTPAQQPQHQQSKGNSLDGVSSAAPVRVQGELSASALAAQKRAEAAEKRGVQQGGGKLAKKLAKEKQQSPYAIEQPMPEPTNTQWN